MKKQMTRKTCLAFLFALLSVSLGFGQSNVLSLSTTVPFDLTVCDQAKTFGLRVANNGTKTVYQVAVNPGLPTGINYLAGSLSGMQQSLVAGQFYFTADSLVAGEVRQLSYQANATCSAITSTSTGIQLVSNAASATFRLEGQATAASEAGGSNSYNLRWADLFYANIVNQTFTGLPNQTYTREVVVQNGGTGRLSSVVLTASYQSGISILGLNTGSVVFGTNTYTVTLGAADFALGGNGDNYLDQDEVIIIKEDIKIITCSEEVTTNYQLSWGCNAAICQNVPEQAKMLIGIGNPFFQAPPIVSHEPTNFGCSTGTIVYNAGNRATSEQIVGASNAYNIIMILEESPLVTITNVYLNDVLISDYSLNVNAGQIIFTDIITSDPDGSGSGLEDLDGDGFYDDLALGESVSIKVEYTLSGASLTSCAQEIEEVLLRFGIKGQNKCYNNVGVGSYRVQKLKSGPEGSPVLDGPTDLVNNETGLFTFQQPFRMDEDPANNSGKVDVINCDAGYMRTKVNIPTGYEWLPGQAFVNGQLATAQQIGTQVFITGGAYDGGRDVYNEAYSIELRPTCDAQTGLAEVKFELEAICSSCATPIPAGCGSVYVQTHNSCEGNGGTGQSIYLQTLSYQVQRSTFGWTNSAMTSKVNANTPGVALNRAYECDSVKLITRGVVKGSAALAVVDASLRINYTAPATAALFDFGSGVISLYDASSGQTYDCAMSAPTLSNSGSGFLMEYDINPCVLAHITDSLRVGDSVNIVITVAVRKESSLPIGAYLLPSFRAHYKAYRSDNYENAGFDNWGANLNILKLQHITTSTLAGNQVFGGCETAVPILRTRTIGGLGFNQDFPNEFRYTEDWGEEVVFNIPNGFDYVPNSSEYHFLRGNSTTLNVNLAEPSYNALNRTLTYMSSATFAAGWPKIEKRDVIHRFIEFKIKAESCKTDQKNINMPVEVDLIQYTASPNDACKIYLNDQVFNNVFEFRQVEIDGEADLEYVSGYEQSFSWTVRLSNSQGLASNNVWMDLQNLSSKIQITSIENVTNVTPVNVLYTVNGTHTLVNTGILTANTERLLKITAKSSNCDDTALDSILVSVGFSCADITTMNEPSACLQKQFPLYFDPKPANLQYILADAVPVDFCTPAEFDLDLYSSLPGNMYDVQVFMELPTGVSFVDAAYTYPLSASTNPLPAPTAIDGVGTLGWDLTAIIPGMNTGFIGSRDTTRNKLDLDIRLTTACGFDPASYVKFHITGVKNCGERVNYVAQKRITILGFPEIDSLFLSLAADQDLSCAQASNFTLNLVNLNDEPTESTTEVELTLPAGITYTGGTPLANTTANLDGTTTLTWTQAPGIAGGGALNFTGSLSLTDPSYCGPFVLHATSSTDGQVFCAATGESCVLTATTATASFLLNRRAVSAQFTAPDTTCLDQSLSPSYTADCPVTHFWDFGDGFTSTSANPTHSYSGSEASYTLIHGVSNACGSDTASLVIYAEECCISTVLEAGICKGCDANMSVLFDPLNPACAYVTSCKDLSNVVLEDCFGHRYKFDGLTGKTGYFCMPDGHPIATVWVKSGCFKSGDGPGYGRRFNHPCSPCASPSANKALNNGNTAQVNESQIRLEAYPNPFIASTVLEFTPKQDGTVSLNVYDLHGKLITTLFEGEVKAGESYKNTFTPKTPAAIYYVRLLDQQGSQILQKLIQLK